MTTAGERLEDLLEVLEELDVERYRQPTRSLRRILVEASGSPSEPR